MKFIVSVAIDGRLDVDVEAKDWEEARQKACLEAGNLDLNRIEFINVSAVNAEREDGVFKDY